MLTERIIETLESMDISVSSMNEQDGNFYCELEFYSPAGEDFIFTVWFDGTPEDFVEQFAAYEEDFDPDEHAAGWIEGRGTNGIPNSIAALIKDAENIKEILEETAAKLQNLDVEPSHDPDEWTNDMIEEVERLNDNTPEGIIRDADTILTDYIDNDDREFPGFAQDIFNIWRDTTDKSAFRKLFYEFTGVEFDEYLMECCQNITR